MAQVLWVGTSLGLFAVRWGSDRWACGSPLLPGASVTAVLDDDRDGTVYAATRSSGRGTELSRSTDAATWASWPAPGGDASGRTLVTALEAGGPSEAGVLWAGTNDGGLWRSTDRGDTWTPVDGPWPRSDDGHLHSIHVDPRDPARIAVALSPGGIWHSADAGLTWTPRMRAGRGTPSPVSRSEMPAEAGPVATIEDPQRLTVCRTAPDTWWVQNHRGLFRSTAAGDPWDALSDPSPSAAGFAAVAHPSDPLTAWFVPMSAVDRPTPVDARLVVNRTRNGGLSFKTFSHGLPGAAYDTIGRHGLDVERTGRNLALGSTTGGLWISGTSGELWHAVETRLPSIACVRWGRDVQD